jgi:hypothetical protein
VAWSVKVTEECAAWFTALIKDDLNSATQVAQAVALQEEGPALGRPLVDRIQGSRIHHLKELRPGSARRSEIRCSSPSIPPGRRCCCSAATRPGTGSGTGRTSRVAERLYLEYTTDG